MYDGEVPVTQGPVTAGWMATVFDPLSEADWDVEWTALSHSVLPFGTVMVATGSMYGVTHFHAMLDSTGGS